MRRPLFLLPLLGAAALTSVLVFALDAPDPALLANGGFENGTDGWQVNVGGTLSIVNGPSGDDHFARITLKLSSAALVQRITVQPGSSYRVTGTLVAVNGGVSQVRPELQVFDSTGGSLNSFSIAPLLQSGSWSFDVLLPCDVATAANFRVWVTGSISATADLDDLGLKAVAPSTPCATDTPTPSDTLEPTATAIAQPTSSATASATATATRTRTPTRTPTSTRTSTVTPSSVANTPTETPPASDVATATNVPPSTPSPQAVATSTLTPSNGLLINGGFEAIDGSSPAAWRHFGGELETTSAPVHGGSSAALLKSATTSTKWAYETVQIAPGAWYELDAFVYQNDPGVDAAWLRISWYASDDASGSALVTSDSLETVSGPQDEFRALSSGSVQAPDGAHSASARILLRPVSAEEASIVIDDASFDVATPATPTATITAPATSTPTPPRPTATPTASRTATAAPSSTSTRTVSPTGTATRLPTSAAATAPNAVATATATSFEAATERTPTQRPPATPTAPFATATAFTTPTPSNGLLINGGFEASDEEGVLGWQTYGGRLAQVTDPVWSGGYAGAFDSSTDSTKWLYQTVAVAPDAWYTFSAYVNDNDPDVDGAFLRISWYASGDASGSAIASADSFTTLSQAAASYQQLTTGSVQAPPDARSARARIVLRPRSAADAQIFVDEAWFVASAPAESNADQPDGAVSAPAADVPPSAGTTRSVGASAGRTSEVAAAGKPPAAFIAQPSPVIRRGSVLPPMQAPRRNGSSDDWWRWALPLAAASAVAGAGWGAWWRDRRNAAATSEPLVPSSHAAYNPPEFPTWEC